MNCCNVAPDNISKISGADRTYAHPDTVKIIDAADRRKRDDMYREIALHDHSSYICATLSHEKNAAAIGKLGWSPCIIEQVNVILTRVQVFLLVSLCLKQY